MTKWQTRRELVTKNLPMWRVFRIVDDVEELDIRLYDEDEAEIIAMDMGRGELLEEGDETAFRASAYEMDKEDW